MKDTNEQHSHFCNCEECTWARGGEICATCGCIVGRGCPCESVEMKNFELQATDRVSNSILLVAYCEILIDYPWDNQEDHFEWVANAPISEILDWCQVTMGSIK